MNWNEMSNRAKGFLGSGVAATLMLLASLGIWGPTGFLVVLLILSVIGLILGFIVAVED